jgi:lauroyl/myristoyl acyltransferase
MNELPPASQKTGFARRLGVFGDLPSRFLRHSMRIAPWFLEPVLIAGWVTLFFAIAKKQRRAVASNLRALHPHWGGLRASGGAWRVFWTFACTYVDALRCETGTGAVDWAIEGQQAFDDLAQRKEGCLILTAHMGNYDLAAPLFSSRFGRTLYAVRAPERQPEMQAIREAELRRKEAEYPQFRTLYNTSDNHLGVVLANLLAEGNIVAVQGDRVVFDVSPMEVTFDDGLVMKLPKGPLYLARATGVACFPLFIVRDGWRRYRVKVFPALELPPRKRGEDPEAAKIWAGAVLEIVRPHWEQWFVFEPLLRRTEVKS